METFESTSSNIISDDDGLMVAVSSDNSDIDVPEELRKALLNFSIAFLIDKPKDVVDYAVNYFTTIQIGRLKVKKASIESNGGEGDGSKVMTASDYGAIVHRKTGDVGGIECETVYRRSSEYMGGPFVRSYSDTIVLPRRSSSRGENARKVSIHPDSERSSVERRSTADRSSGASGDRRSYSERRSSTRKSTGNRVSIRKYEPLPRRKSLFLESFDTGDIHDDDQVTRTWSLIWNNDLRPSPFPKLRKRKSIFAESYEPDDDADDALRGSDLKILKSPEQMKHILKSIKGVSLFKSLYRQQLLDVVIGMKERRVRAGEIVVVQGNVAHDFYVIDTGVFKVFKDDVLVHTFFNEGVFGESALIAHRLRLATIRAATDGLLWTIDRYRYRRIMEARAFYKRKFYEKQLRKVYMLQVLPKEKLMSLADALQEKVFKKGDIIFTQGDKPDGMYVVLDGVVQIKARDRNGIEKNVHKIGDSQNFFDELALLQIKARSKLSIARDVHKIGASQRFFGELALLKNQHTVRMVSAYAASHYLVLAFLSLESFDRIVGDSVQECYDSIGQNHPHYANLIQFYKNLNIEGKLL